MCRKLGGVMAAPSGATVDRELGDLLLPHIEACGYRSWVAVWDETEEGNFTNVYTGEEVDYNRWILNHPDGDVVENCVEHHVTSLRWNDLNCLR